jgi:hypothetical protein
MRGADGTGALKDWALNLGALKVGALNVGALKIGAGCGVLKVTSTGVPISVRQYAVEVGWHPDVKDDGKSVTSALGIIPCRRVIDTFGAR